MKSKVVLIVALALVVIVSCTTPTAAPANTPITPAATPAEEEPTQPPIPPPDSSLAYTELSVHFVDVGQGDSILIDSGTTEILIDGGEASQSQELILYLQKYVDEPPEVMVATHPHADHIGGLCAVLDNFVVDDVWYNGESCTSATCNKFMSAAQVETPNVHEAKCGDQICAGQLSLNVLNPARPFLDSTNNRSIVLILHYGSVDFLFEGDAEKEAESSMLAAGLIPDVEILKVGHHGSRTASSEQFLQACQPEVAVYMAGIGNTYGHPHQETITALAGIGAKIYGTDVNGSICITTDGENYSVQLERQALSPLPPPEPPSVNQPSPVAPTPCSGATAICNDGTCSYSKHRSGTCSHHGGVRQWVNRPPN